MKNSPFLKPKESFLDTVNAKDYIQLDRVSTIYQSLKSSIQKPLKMVLLYGKPGTGKSMLLSKLSKDIASTKQKVVVYHTPLVDESEFLRSLARDIFDINHNGELSFTEFNHMCEKIEFEKTPIALLDEAQLYSTALMEKIRLLSDSRRIKFVITLHKTDEEDIIAKEHFQTRIWESIELYNATHAELKIYIQKKLMKINCFDIANMFNDKNIKTIYSITHGNYRDTNKLMYTLFDLHIAYEEQQPSKINYTSISCKLIEMAGLHSGLLHD